MSGEQFLRAHGWKLGRNLWWHNRLPEQGHQFEAALLQQAQWLAADIADIRQRVEDYGDDVPEKAIRLIRLILGMPNTSTPA